MENFYTDNYNRVWGNKAIGISVVITSTNNEVTIISATNEYVISIPSGVYHSQYVTGTSELIDAIKKEITTNSYPIEVFLGGNHKDIKYNSIVFRLADGSKIQDITGSFFDNFFNSI